ncbi:MAG: hypothetical protein ABS36_08625 [Acidobacteria bacterium SCN 69-37]|nr:MAG: hypothetical protein ABS36_08625 [Acidobacteria bacterium SCN 69-37]
MPQGNSDAGGARRIVADQIGPLRSPRFRARAGVVVLRVDGKSRRESAVSLLAPSAGNARVRES